MGTTCTKESERRELSMKAMTEARLKERGHVVRLTRRLLEKRLEVIEKRQEAVDRFHELDEEKEGADGDGMTASSVGDEEQGISESGVALETISGPSSRRSTLGFPSGLMLKRRSTASMPVDDRPLLCFGDTEVTFTPAFTATDHLGRQIEVLVSSNDGKLVPYFHPDSPMKLADNLFDEPNRVPRRPILRLPSSRRPRFLQSADDIATHLKRMAPRRGALRSSAMQPRAWDFTVI